MFVLFSLIRRSRNTTGDGGTKRKGKKPTREQLFEGADCALDVGHDASCKVPFPVVIVVVVVGLSLLPPAFCRRVQMSSPALHTCSLKLASARRATEDRILRVGLGGEGQKKIKGKEMVSEFLWNLSRD